MHPNDTTNEIPYGYCQCGCGQKTPISNKTSSRDGTVKGQHVRYITGHQCRRSPEERFWEKIDKRGPDECWPWLAGSDQRGYGSFWDGEHFGKAHRYSYKLANGDFADELDCLHRCDNPPCCNPAHLFLGTAKDNVDDMVSKGRARGKVQYGVDNPKAKLAVEDVLHIRDLAAKGVSAREIARRYGMNDSSIGDVVNRVTWKHVK